MENNNIENNNMEINLDDSNLENDVLEESKSENKNSAKGIIILIAILIIFVVGVRFASKMIGGFNKSGGEFIGKITFSYSRLDVTESQKEMLESVGFGSYMGKVKEYTGKYPDDMNVELYNSAELCVRFNIDDYEGYFYCTEDIAYGNIIDGVNCIYEWFPYVELVEVVYNYDQRYYMDYYPLTMNDLNDNYNFANFSSLDGYDQVNAFATHDILDKYFDGNIPGEYVVSYSERFNYLSPNFKQCIEVHPNGHNGDSFVIEMTGNYVRLYKIL